MPRKQKTKESNRKNLYDEIVQIFRRFPQKYFNYKQIAKQLGVTKDIDKKAVEATLVVLSQKNEIEASEQGKYRSNSKSSYVVGTVDMTSSGAAYIVCDKDVLEDDVYINHRNLNHALHGDVVRVLLYAKSKKKLEGEIVEIIESSDKLYVGVIEVSKNFAFVVVEDRTMPYDIFISLNKTKGAKNGQLVTARITEWPQRAKNPFGEIVEVLGNPGENDAEMHAILAEYDLPYKFPLDVEAEAEKIPENITDEEIKKRRDFRSVTTFTIDPHDAKDFDDALSLQKLPNGLWEVGVHIADVTHYVTPESIIEEEAYNRATSVYLVDRVVPMLPEKLSNGLCSLRPNEDKLCFSAVFLMDDSANVKEEWFGRTVIHSDRRFSYEEAQEVIEGKEGDLKQEILQLDVLAKKLREKRFNKGAIAFDKVEVKFNLKEDGKPLGIYFKVSKDANKLIEEFMLLANKKVAEFVGKQLKKTFVYRIHDVPNVEKLENFAQFVRKFGYDLSYYDIKDASKAINKLLDQIKGTPVQDVFENLAVRSMAKAAYSTENIGHYGLAFQYYSHFTSPIRRYPDMMVHRLLQRYIDGKRSVNELDWEDYCKHSSEREMRAANAERASIKYKQVEFMADKVGEEFEGVISGVTEWGIYVEIIETRCEGMVSTKDLDDDFYSYDENNYCLRGKYKNKEYRLGEKILIKVVKANLAKKQLDFVLA